MASHDTHRFSAWRPCIACRPKTYRFDASLLVSVQNAEENGIVFIDEVDKVADSHDMDGGRQSRHKTEGVQKELLSIVEGTTLNTQCVPDTGAHNTQCPSAQRTALAPLLSPLAALAQCGRTTCCLCAPAPSTTRGRPTSCPSCKVRLARHPRATTLRGDTPHSSIPHCAGRLPIRVQLNALTLEDLERILVEPRHALLEQTSALLATEGLNVEFTECGVKEMARIATVMNRGENIGARRLRTVVSKVTEDISYNAPTLARRGETQHVVDAAFVKKMLSEVVANNDLSRYVL